MDAPPCPFAPRPMPAVPVTARLVVWLVEPTKTSEPPLRLRVAPVPRLLAEPPAAVTVVNSSSPPPTVTSPEKVLTPVRRMLRLVCAQPPRSSLMASACAPEMTPEKSAVPPVPAPLKEMLPGPAKVTLPVMLSGDWMPSER